jgi:hypothetical protein
MRLCIHTRPILYLTIGLSWWSLPERRCQSRPIRWSIRAVSRQKLVIEQEGRIQRFLSLQHGIDQIIPNPHQPLAAVFARATSPTSSGFIYFIDLRTGQRRRFILDRTGSAYLVERPAELWSPAGQHLQLTRLVDENGVLVPRSLTLVRTLDLETWIRTGRWQGTNIELSLEEHPMFWGWVSDTKLALEATACCGSTSYYLYDLVAGRLDALGSCQAAAPCPILAQLGARTKRGTP